MQWHSENSSEMMVTRIRWKSCSVQLRSFRRSSISAQYYAKLAASILFISRAKKTRVGPNSYGFTGFRHKARNGTVFFPYAIGERDIRVTRAGRYTYTAIKKIFLLRQGIFFRGRSLEIREIVRERLVRCQSQAYSRWGLAS